MNRTKGNVRAGRMLAAMALTLAIGAVRADYALAADAEPEAKASPPAAPAAPGVATAPVAPEAPKTATAPEAATPESATAPKVSTAAKTSAAAKASEAPAGAGGAGAAATQAAPAAPTAAARTEAETVWRAYEKRWSETADYAAGFRQTIEVPDIGSRVESAGRFYFAKPGLVRWEYTEGPPQTVVGDGTWIWLYQPDLEQVYKIPYAQAFGRGGLVELLAGRQGISERYTSTLERPDADTVRILLKSKTEGGGDFEVTLAAKTFDLRAVTVHDAAGSTTHMTFAEPRRNGGSDAEHFTFTPPPGVDIIADTNVGF